MPTFLSDPPRVLFVGLFALVAITGTVAARYQNRRTLVPFGIAVLLLLGLVLADRLNESPREESVRKVQEMVAAVNAQNWDKLAANVSDQFDYGGKLKKAGLVAIARQAGSRGVTLSASSFDREAVEVVSPTQIRIGFMAHAGDYPAFIEATFAKDPDGQFRMIGFAVYNAAQRKNGPRESIPGLD